MRPLLLRFFAAAVVSLLAAPAAATVVMALSLEEMTSMSTTVVHGVVRRTETNWDDGKRGIWTWAEIDVKETLKGAPSATVLVKQPGGVVYPVHQTVSGAGKFEEGEEVLLFLSPATDEPRAFVLLAMGAGKVRFESTVGPKVARRDLSGLSFARPGAKGLAGPLAEREHLGAADALLKRIRVAVRGAAR